MSKTHKFIRSIEIEEYHDYASKKDYKTLVIRVGDMDRLLKKGRTTFTVYSYNLFSKVDHLNSQMYDDLVKSSDSFISLKDLSKRSSE